MELHLTQRIFLTSSLFITLLHIVSGCEVGIRKPYHPMYVQTGLPMKLVCTATGCLKDERIKLQWDRQTGVTKWTKNAIIPQVGNGWITRNLYEEPSGSVESTLIREVMTVEDRGWYYCRDEKDDNSFSIWVTALKINTSPNVTLRGGDTGDTSLTCTISGLHSNLPHIEYVWFLNDQEIVNITDRFTLLPPSNGNSTLVLHKPRKRDGGLYICAFYFRTNLGPVNFSQPIYVDASKVTVSGTSSINQSIFVIVPLLSIFFTLFCQ